MNIYVLSLICGFILFTSSMFGVVQIFFVKKQSETLDCIFNSISASVMISCACFGLLVPSFDLAQSINQNALLITFIGFVFGCLIIILFDYLLSKIDTSKHEYLLPLTITLHNIPEGMIVGVSCGLLVLSNQNITALTFIVLSISIQNIPEAMCSLLPLINTHNKKKTFLIGIFVNGVEIISCLFATLFISLSLNLLPFLLAFASGAMIIISVCELLPQAFIKKKYLSSFFFIFFFILMFILENLF